MPINKEKYLEIRDELKSKNVGLVAVSKTKSVEDILELYNLGQRDFGENYVQELVDKENVLPKDIRWHFIGHLQTNKVKYIAPFVHLIHGVESYKLLNEIEKQANKNSKKINVLLQIHIAKEETKFGLDENELTELMEKLSNEPKENVNIIGLMGMASFTQHENIIRSEFKKLKSLFDKHKAENFNTLSMGMSSDYKIAINEGSTLVRIGSLLFGERVYDKS